jgi:hypothetical protein
MPTSVLSPPTPGCPDLAATFFGSRAPEDVVEIGLLVPAEWAVALMELSKKRQESMGQLLRGVIGRALMDGNRDGDS